MERAERNGLAFALVGHVLLFGALSLGLLTARIPKPPIADTMDVTFTDKTGLTSAAPKVASEAPAPSEAPDQGAPEDSAPPPPAPEQPPEPKPLEPKPTPPKPTLPKPTPEKPTPAPPKPEKPAPKPEPKPKPAPEKPKPEPKPEQPKPEKARPEKTRPEKAAPEKASSRPTPEKRHAGLPSDLLSDLPSDSPGKGKASAKPKGSRIGKDFLKGLSPDKSAGKADAPNAKAISPLALNGIGALIKQQVKPNYNPPSGGADSASIVTTLNITMARDGSVSSVEVVGHRGVNDSNGGYVKQADDAAIRAVRRSSPLKLPPELYDGGWENITLNFSPAQMQ